MAANPHQNVFSAFLMGCSNGCEALLIWGLGQLSLMAGDTVNLAEQLCLIYWNASYDSVCLSVCLYVCLPLSLSLCVCVHNNVIFEKCYQTSQESHSLEPPPLRRIVNFKGKMVASYWGALAEATQ